MLTETSNPRPERVRDTQKQLTKMRHVGIFDVAAHAEAGAAYPAE